MNAPPAVASQPLPRKPVIMHQRWRRLLFLHWSWDADAVQATLPAGLTVETWEGRAWLGVVPFSMEGVRPRFCPEVPGLSNFLELNVRTYVRDAAGRTGVWFYSLDCAQPVAVWAARTFFRLPYFHATMREEVRADRIRYASRRRGDAEESRFEYAPQGEARPARAGSLEEFLVERYRLFAAGHEGLLSGQVWHAPYEIQSAEVREWSIEPLREAGFAMENHPPEHVAYAPGVDVRIYGLEEAAGYQPST